MSTKSVACTVFLIICFSSYTLGKPYDNREKESRPVIAAQDEPCGMMCKAGKAKGKVMNRTKSAVDGVRSKIKGVKDTVIDVLGFGDDGKRDVGSKPVLYVQPGIVYDFEPYPVVKEIDDETTTTTTIAKHSDNDTDIYTHIYVQDNSGESRHENDNTNNALSKSAESKLSIDKDKQPTNKQNAFDENIDNAESVVDDKGKSSLGGGGGELLNKVEGLNNNDGIPINTDKLLFESEKKIFVDKTESSLTTALRTGFDDKVESASDAANDNLTKNKDESTLDNGKSDLKVDKNEIVVEKNKSDLKIELDKAESALNNKSDDVRRSDKEVKSSKSNLTAELDKTKFSLDADKSDSKVALNETKSTLDAGEEDLLKAGLDKVSATTLDPGKVDPKIGSDTISTTDKAESASEGKGESELNFELAENRFNNNLDDDKEKPIETATNTSMAIITNVVTAKSEASIAAAEDISVSKAEDKSVSKAEDKSVSKAELGKSNSSLSIDNDSTSKPLETIANFDFGKKESATIIDQATSSNSSDRSSKTESNLNANNHTDIIKNDALSKAIQNINDGKSNESLTTAIPTTFSGNSNISSIGAVDTMTSKSNSSYSDESKSSGNENKPKSSLLELVKNQASAVSSEGAKESERLADMAKAGKSELGSLLKKTESGIGGLFGNKNKIF